MPTETHCSPPSAGLHHLPALWPALLLAAGIWLGNLPGLSLIAAATCWLLLVLFLLVISQYQSRRIVLWRLCSFATLVLTGILLTLLFGRTLACKRAYIDAATGPVALAGMALEPGRIIPGWYGAPDRLEFGLQVQAQKRGGANGWREASYRVVALVENPGDLRVDGGQYLTLAVELEPLTGYANPGGFDWRQYSGRRMIAGMARVRDGTHVRLPPAHVSFFSFTSVRRLAAMVHTRLYELHGRLYPDPLIRSVADAILLGDRRALDSRLRGWFTQSGTVHVLVVSGLHLGFIAAVVYLLLGMLLGRGYVSAALACAVLLGYALATGGRPPVMRAWLLVSFALFALPARRQRAVLNSLAVAFMLLLLANPSWLSDAGFQLSFAAVAGIGMGMPVIERFTSGRDWWKVRLWRWLFRLVAVCAVAQLAVAPLVAYHFGRFTPVAFIANPPVVLLAGLAVLGGFLADMTALIWFEAGQLLALAVTYILAVMTALARWFSSLSWSSLEAPLPGLVDLVLCWLALWMVIKLAEGGRRFAGMLVLVLLVWLNLAGWRPVVSSLANSMEVTFLDLGRMTCPVARFPGGAVLLADPSGSGALSSWSARQLAGPYLRRHHAGRLDWLLVRGEGPTRWRWVRALLEDFSPGTLILTRANQFGGFDTEIRAYCARRGIDVRLATATDTLMVNGAKLYFSDPGMIPVLACHGQAVLLSGGSSVKETLELKENLADQTLAVTELAAVPSGAGRLLMDGSWVITAGGGGSGDNKSNVLETGRTGAVRFKMTGGGITAKWSR